MGKQVWKPTFKVFRPPGEFYDYARIRLPDGFETPKLPSKLEAYRWKVQLELEGRITIQQAVELNQEILEADFYETPYRRRLEISLKAATARLN